MSIPKIETHTNKKTSSPQQHRPRTRSPDPAAHHPAAIIQRARAAPESLSAADVLQLQRTIGNQAVGRLLAEIGQSKHQPTGSRDSQYPIQPKLTINPPGDIYEQEADRVAKQVVDQISQPVSQGQGQLVQQKDQCEGGECVQTKPDMQRQEMLEEEELIQGKMTETIQSQPEPEEEEELLQGTFTEALQRQEPEEEELMLKPLVQRQAEGRMAATQYLEDPIKQARSSGQTLADNTRTSMEQAFGVDFSGVRVHMGAQSDQLSRLIQARAFTTGQDIFFRHGEYNPSTRTGQELLSHELTHVVQQNRSAIQLEPGEKGATRRSRPEITTPYIEQESTNKTIHRKMVDAWVGVEVLPVFSIDNDNDNDNVTSTLVDSLSLNKKVSAKEPSHKIKIGDTKYIYIKYKKSGKDKKGVVNFDKLRSKGPKERTGAWDVVKGGAEIYGDVTDVYDLRAGSLDRGKELRELEEGYLKDKEGSTETKDWQQKHGAEVVSGVSETLGSIMNIANTIRKWRSRKNSEIMSDSFDVVATTVSTGAAVAKIIDSSSKLDKDTRGGTGSDVWVTSPTTKAQSYTTTVSDFASKVGGNIADFTGLIKDAKDIFITFKKAWSTWRKKSSSKEDKARASFEAGKTLLNIVKDGVATARNLLFTLTNAWQAGLSKAVPGLGIIINALKLCMNVYDLIKANKHRMLMFTIIKDKGYKLARELWKINRKRIKRQVINITNAFLKIGGDIVTFSGVGAIAGVALKGSASVIELGAKGLRTIKQVGRNRATQKGAWKMTTKVFNVEKSTSEKRKKYNLLAEQIYDCFEKSTTKNIEKIKNQLSNYIRAAGLSCKSWFGQMQADPDKGHEMLIKSLKRRE